MCDCWVLFRMMVTPEGLNVSNSKARRQERRQGNWRSEVQYVVKNVGATGVDSKPRPGNGEDSAENDAMVEGVPLAFPFVWGPQGVTDGDSGALAAACVGGGEGER